MLLALAGTPREAHPLAEPGALVTEMQAAGLTVMLDMHVIPRGDEDFGTEWALASDANFAAYVAMASKVADTLGGMGHVRTLPSLYNEPVQDCDGIAADTPRPGGWPDRLKRLHDAARAAAPDLPLVLSGACLGRVEGLETVDPGTIGDDNAQWSFQSYDPYFYSHQNADWTGDMLQFMAHLPWPPRTLDDETAHRPFAEAALGAAALHGPLARAATPAALARLVEDYRATQPDPGLHPCSAPPRGPSRMACPATACSRTNSARSGSTRTVPSSTCPATSDLSATSANWPRHMAVAGPSGR